MGTVCRVFFINEDDTLRRIPLARYERLLRNDSAESFPEHKDKKVRNALAFVECYNREPYELIAIQYSILSFDAEGRIDERETEKEMKLGAEMIMPVESEPGAPNVVDATGRFAIKKYHDRYSWTPTQEIETAIFKAIFGKTIQ